MVAKGGAVLTPHPSFTVLSPKVLGIAIARYDFCARDMRELSLLKGDVVKIYTKMSANGWWRGEVNGRVSRHPRGGGTGQSLAPTVGLGTSLRPAEPALERPSSLKTGT